MQGKGEGKKKGEAQHKGAKLCACGWLCVLWLCCGYVVFAGRILKFSLSGCVALLIYPHALVWLERRVISSAPGRAATATVKRERYKERLSDFELLKKKKQKQKTKNKKQKPNLSNMILFFFVCVW